MPREQIILDHLRLEFLQNPAAAVAVPQRQASGQTVFSMKERDWFHPVTNILPPTPNPCPFLMQADPEALLSQFTALGRLSHPRLRQRRRTSLSARLRRARLGCGPRDS